MYKKLFFASLFLTGCATTPEKHPSSSVQLIVWEISESENCEPDKYPIDEQINRTGLGLAHWPSQTDKRPDRVGWYAYGAQANTLFGKNGPKAICVSLHKRARSSQMAGASLFSAKIRLLDNHLLVDKVTNSSNIQSTMIIRKFGDTDAIARYNWSNNNNKHNIEEVNYDTPPSGRINILVAIAEDGFNHQLNAAVEQLLSSQIPNVTTRPPIR